MESDGETPDQVRQRILNAARERFRQFGYNKTTMAEIAGDCSMSAANLYRYFENKLDIAAGLAGRCLDEEESALRAVIQDRSLSAAQRLGEFVLATLHRTHQLWSEQPRINELVEAVSTQRKAFLGTHLATKQTLLVSLLEDGIASGEFADCEPREAAQAIGAAITLFDVPSFMHLHSLEQFEALARGVTQLVLTGLQRRQTHNK